MKRCLRLNPFLIAIKQLAADLPKEIDWLRQRPVSIHAHHSSVESDKKTFTRDITHSDIFHFTISEAI